MSTVGQTRGTTPARLSGGSGYAVISADERGRVTLLNPEAEELTGWTENDARGKPLREIFHLINALTGTLCEDLAARVLSSGGAIGLAADGVLITRGGAECRVTGKACPMRDAAGRITGMVLLCRDADQASRAQAALRESEALTRSISSHLQSGMIYRLIRRPDGSRRFTYVSGSVQRLYGISPQQAIEDAHLIYRRVHPEDVERLVREEEEAHRTMTTLRTEVRMMDPSGGVRWSSFVSSPRLQDDGTTCWDGIELDITERKRAEAALRESEERFRAIFNATFQFTGLMTPEGVMVEVNQAALDFAGVTAAEVIGKPFWDARWWRADAARVRQLRAAIVRAAGGEFVRYEVLIQGAGSTTATIDFSIKPIVGLDGTVKLLVPEGRDISDRKRAEEEKLKLQEELAQARKMESIGQLAGGVAHDFNNMLAVILGNTAMALERGDLAPALRAELESIRTAAEHSAGLTRQLLAFARKQTVVPRVLNLNETVAGMLRMLRQLIGEDIDLVWSPAASAGMVLMDSVQLDQLLTNLLINARDAIGGAGMITIETKNVVLDEAYCADHPGALCGEYVLLAVSDNGCGMDNETLARLFEPFFTTKELGRGTGLGLATVYGIVKQNHGFVNAYSEVGKGTTFSIYLPRSAGVVREAGTNPPAAAATSGGHETILLVEDDQAILELAERMLGKLGYTVLAASTADAALRLAAEHPEPIHLLITDVVMPVMNGRVLAERLLQLQPHVKRLFMSGYTANVVASHGVLEEGLHFIQKPFSKQELDAKVREALENK
jgi:PAS domain S-box-containing protein